MTNEQRKALLERLRNRIHDAPMPTEHLLDGAADQIEADDQRIAELEIEAEAQYHRGYYDGRAALGDEQ